MLAAGTYITSWGHDDIGLIAHAHLRIGIADGEGVDGFREGGEEWKFRLCAASERLLQSAPALPPSKVAGMKPRALPLRAGLTPVVAKLQKQGMVLPTHSPCNSLAGQSASRRESWY